MLWLQNDAGKLLLARRADHKAHDPGLWGPSVTGKLEAGEDSLQALKRETMEELSLEPQHYHPKFLFKTEFLHPDGETRVFEVYSAHISDEAAQSIVFDTDEVAEVGWMAVPEIKRLLATDGKTVVVASAFVLWKRIFDALGQN